MFSLKVIKFDELSNKYLWFFLNKIAIGFVSYTFIIIVFGYFFLTSIFFKKSIDFKGLSTSFISNNDIAEPLKTVNYLEKIEVKKKYPDTIVIKIYETKPVGIVFKNNTKYIIDTLSNLITFNDNLVNNNFPNIFGKGAEKDFINFFEQLKNNKFPRKQVKNYYYFQVDRWDVKLTNNQIIKFPSKKRKEAIQQSIKLLNHEDFENYKVIDLRIHGKIVVE